MVTKTEKEIEWVIKWGREWKREWEKEKGIVLEKKTGKVSSWEWVKLRLLGKVRRLGRV